MLPTKEERDGPKHNFSNIWHGLEETEADLLSKAAFGLSSAWRYATDFLYSVDEFNDAQDNAAAVGLEIMRAGRLGLQIEELQEMQARLHNKQQMSARHAVFCCYHVHDVIDTYMSTMRRINTLVAASELYKQCYGVRRQSPLSVLNAKVPFLSKVRDGIAHEGEIKGQHGKHASRDLSSVNAVSDTPVLVQGCFEGNQFIQTVNGRTLKFSVSKETGEGIFEAVRSAYSWPDMVFEFSDQLTGFRDWESN